jgi:hypothetical protein
MKCAAAALSVLIVLFCSSAGAGPIVDAATRAEALQAEGKTVEALEALEEAASALWEEAPLAFRTVMVVDSTGADGVRTERADSTFRPDEKMTVYVEPVGYGFGAPNSPGTVGFTVDLVIENMTGQVLVDAEDAFTVGASTSGNNRDFGMTLSVAVPFIRPGDYKAVFNVDDRNSAKSATFEVPFTVVLPAAEGGTAAAPQ